MNKRWQLPEEKKESTTEGAKNKKGATEWNLDSDLSTRVFFSFQWLTGFIRYGIDSHRGRLWV